MAGFHWRQQGNQGWGVWGEAKKKKREIKREREVELEREERKRWNGMRKRKDCGVSSLYNFWHDQKKIHNSPESSEFSQSQPFILLICVTKMCHALSHDWQSASSCGFEAEMVLSVTQVPHKHIPCDKYFCEPQHTGTRVMQKQPLKK